MRLKPFIAERPTDSRILYAGGFEYRSVSGAFVLLLWFAMGVFGVWVCRASDSPLLAWVAVVIFTAVGVLHVIWMLLARRKSFSIETAGIANGNRFVPWSQIRRFAAEGQPKGIGRTLFYETLGSEPFGQHSLYSSRLIRASDYDRLIALLREAGIEKAHPGLVLGGYQSA